MLEEDLIYILFLSSNVSSIEKQKKFHCWKQFKLSLKWHLILIDKRCVVRFDAITLIEVSSFDMSNEKFWV